MLIKKDSNAIMLYFCFLIVTLSYVLTLPFGSYKMIAVAISTLYPLIYIASRMIIRKSDFILIVMLMSSAIFQDTSFTQKFISFFFYVTLIMWALHGNEIFKNLRCIRAAGMGITTGILVGLLYSKNEIIVQLSGLFNSRSRLWGAFSHPNHLGAMTTAALIALVTYIVFRDKKMTKIIFYPIVAILVVVLLETKSRTALIMFIVYLLVYSLHFVGKMKRSMQVFVYVLLFFCVIAIGYSFFTGYMQEDLAYSGRLKIFNTMTVTPKTFWIGNGMVDAASLNRANAGGGAMEIGWVMLFYKNGFIGIFAYIFMLYKIVKHIILINNLKRKWLAFAVLSSMLVGTLGEAYIVNITNVSPMLEWILLSTLTFKEDNFEEKEY